MRVSELVAAGNVANLQHLRKKRVFSNRSIGCLSLFTFNRAPLLGRLFRCSWGFSYPRFAYRGCFADCSGLGNAELWSGAPKANPRCAVSSLRINRGG